MDAPFIYDRYVTGKHFIGREDNCTVLKNLLTQGIPTVLYEPPQTGKTSLIHQTLFQLRLDGRQFAVAELSLLNVRHTDAFLLQFGSAVLRAFGSTPEEYARIVETYLAGTHFVFDAKQYSDNDRLLSTNWETDLHDMETLLRLPHRLAGDRGQQLIFVIEEFQNIEFTENARELLDLLDKLIDDMRTEPLPGCTFLFTGSMVNAMKDLFTQRRLFYGRVVHLELSDVSEKVLIEYIVRGFLTSGKVIERELLSGVCRRFRKHLCYINHFISICDSLSKGYITEPILMEALDRLLAIHRPHFKAAVNRLTTYQLSLLKAILDGKTKFSAAPVIQQYRLNSSANVKRVKDALMKKEIITFDDKDEPVILDPLFEYWLSQYFFDKNE